MKRDDDLPPLPKPFSWCDEGFDYFTAEQMHEYARTYGAMVQADADKVCDSYADENQRFHDEIERLRAELAAQKPSPHLPHPEYDGPPFGVEADPHVSRS